jgi:tetratricopeptide (TPR) repeat protein
MLERFKAIDDSTAALRVAHACSLAAAAITDIQGLIQVSERWTQWVANNDLPALTAMGAPAARWLASNERGQAAVLFRASRLEEALDRFERAHKTLPPRAWDWLFLAMIHSRLGHPSEALRFLQQADEWIIEADKAPSGSEQKGPRWMDLTERPTILILHREAEAVVRFDPVFPANPFAP